MITFDAMNAISPTWGWVVAFCWLAYQLYWPFTETKLQQWHDDFTTRFRRIETGQMSLAEEIEGIDEDAYKELHGYKTFTTGDLKDDGE